MKKILIPMIAVSALAATTVPALAQGYGPQRAPAYSQGGWQNINARQAMLDRRIDQGVRNGAITRAEAFRLRAQFNQIARLEVSYRRGGLTAWERNDLDRRFDRLSAQIRYERRDRDYGYGYGPRR
jgi:hypothetical protein